MSGGSLRTSYGTVRVPKGSILYHATTSNTCILPDKPMLFTTLHPSDWYAEDIYISVIELQRDIELLFMVSLIHKTRIFSSLNKYLGENNTNLAKMNYGRIKSWLPFLQSEKLDGWFSSIENGYAIELALIHDPTILKILECNPIRYNWTNSKYVNNSITPKHWGSVYPLSATTIPFQLVLNERYRTQIENYKKLIASEEPLSTTLSIILENADINYFEGAVDDIKWI